jgi:hemerythrin superfamily protein
MTGREDDQHQTTNTVHPIALQYDEVRQSHHVNGTAASRDPFFRRASQLRIEELAMARATRAASDAPRDAVALLKQDHRTVEELFEQFEEADDDQLQAIAERVCQLLTVHAQIEEEILYPAAKEAFEDEEELDLVNEANVEHQSAKDLIAKIEGMTPEDETFKATVKVLGEYIKHHVKEEEGELFPGLKKTEVDLKEMGAQLFDRKMTLMQELGIEEEEPEAATRKRSTGRSGRSAGAKSRQARASSRKSASRSGGRSARH